MLTELVPVELSPAGEVQTTVPARVAAVAIGLNLNWDKQQVGCPSPEAMFPVAGREA